VGIDTDRYTVEFPERDMLVIGWAGGTGHHNAVGPWLEEIRKIMALYKNTYFVSIGTQYASVFGYEFPGRTKAVPWTSIENYPYVLTHLDIALAPGHESKYHLSKSDLRWLEASAVGVPTVVDPRIYPEAKDYETALVAPTPKDAGDCVMDLLEDHDLRDKLRTNAQDYVAENRDIKKSASQWEAAIS
jgi:glycosyltransferase involved in cell wall biosynthesis